MDGLTRAGAIPRTLVLTGHFPPETGGVERFTWEFVRRLPAEQVVVVAPRWPGDEEFDATLDFPVIRRRGYLLFRDLAAIVAEHGLQAAWITAMAPFGLYAPLVRRAGISRIVGSTHGQEIGWVRAAPTRLAFARMARAVDTVTYLNHVTRGIIAPVAGPGGPQLVQLSGGVDIDRFRPGAGGAQVRLRYGFRSDPVVVCVGRLVRRKGYDVLMRAWPDVRRFVPGARLLIVGDGPMRKQLTQWAAEFPSGSVVVTGAVADDELAAHYDAGTAFLLACRDDRHGLQSEGLGLSVLEASAAGLPVVVGRSGGSSEAVRSGVTGWLIDASRPEVVAHRLVQVLCSSGQGVALGTAGRQWVSERYSWTVAANRLADTLAGRPVIDETETGRAADREETTESQDREKTG